MPTSPIYTPSTLGCALLGCVPNQARVHRPPNTHTLPCVCCYLMWAFIDVFIAPGDEEASIFSHLPIFEGSRGGEANLFCPSYDSLIIFVRLQTNSRYRTVFLSLLDALFEPNSCVFFVFPTRVARVFKIMDHLSIKR